MYAKNSSFEANLTLERRNSDREVSFSSYLNKAEENMVRSLANQASAPPTDHQFRIKPDNDEEIGVFGAEKYFKGEIEDCDNTNGVTFVHATDTLKNMHQLDNELEVEEFDHNFPVKLKSDQTNTHTPSVRSNVSCNSRSRLLPRNKQSNKIENGTKTPTFFARFGCNCMNKKSTQINEQRFPKPQNKMLQFDQNNDRFSSKLADLNSNSKARNDCFTFPVLNSNSNSNSIDLSSNPSSISKPGNLAGKLESENDYNSGGLTLGRKLSLLNDFGIAKGDEMYISSSRKYNKDADSDSSSDLFEIESFSPSNGSFLGHRNSESNCYAPSEVSVDWSVVTASAADFSVVSDYEDLRTGGSGGGWKNFGGNGSVRNEKEEQKKRPGMLSGCTSYKAVRVAGDECKVGGGAAGGRRRLSESMVVGGRF